MKAIETCPTSADVGAGPLVGRSQKSKSSSKTAASSTSGPSTVGSRKASRSTTAKVKASEQNTSANKKASPKSSTVVAAKKASKKVSANPSTAEPAETTASPETNIVGTVATKEASKKPSRKAPTAEPATTTTPMTVNVVGTVTAPHQWQTDAAELAQLIGLDAILPNIISREKADNILQAARDRYLKIVEKGKALKSLLQTYDELPQSFPGATPAITAATANDKPLANPAVLPAERSRPNMAVIFDTETTGLIKTRQVPLDRLPEVIEFYGELVDLSTGKVVDTFESLIKPKKLPISDEIVRITGINTDMVKNELSFGNYLYDINKLMRQGDCVIAHNLGYDKEMLEIECERLGKELVLPSLQICTVQQTMSMKGYRLNLSALHQELFGAPFAGAHRAKADVQALTRCVIELRKRSVL